MRRLLSLTNLIAGSAIALCYSQLGCNDAPTNMFEQIRDLAERSNVTSIEGLLPLLPEELRRNYILRYTSHSSQFASEEYPRVIMTADEGRTMISFSGAPNQRGYNTIEMIEGDENTGFHFREIEFPIPPAHGRVSFNENPTRCAGCHQAPALHRTRPMPFWEPHFRWPGVYGSDDANFRVGSRELASYTHFRRDIAPTHSRYRHLVPYPEGYDAGDDRRIVLESGTVVPHINMGSNLARIESHQMWRDMQASPLFNRFQTVLASWSIGCAINNINFESFFMAFPDPVAARARFQELLIGMPPSELNAINQREQLTAPFLAGGRGIRGGLSQDYSPFGNDTEAALATILEYLGLDIRSYCFSEIPEANGFNDGINNGIIGQIATRIRENLIPHDNPFSNSPYLVLPSDCAAFQRSFTPRTSISNQSCIQGGTDRDFTARAKVLPAAVESTAIKLIDAITTRSDSPLRPPRAVSRCASCHATGAQPQPNTVTSPTIARQFNTSNPLALLGQLSNPSGTLSRQVHAQLRTNPPHGGITRQEQQDILRYLSQIQR